MTTMEMINLIDTGMRTGLTALEIGQRLSAEHGGYTLPTPEQFERDLQALRTLRDLTPGKD